MTAWTFTFTAADALTADWRETPAAACRAALTCQHPAVATQGLVLATADRIPLFG